MPKLIAKIGAQKASSLLQKNFLSFSQTSLKISSLLNQLKDNVNQM